MRSLEELDPRPAPVLPDAEISQDEDGQIVILTGMTMTAEGG